MGWQDVSCLAFRPNSICIESRLSLAEKLDGIQTFRRRPVSHSCCSFFLIYRATEERIIPSELTDVVKSGGALSVEVGRQAVAPRGLYCQCQFKSWLLHLTHPSSPSGGKIDHLVEPRFSRARDVASDRPISSAARRLQPACGAARSEDRPIAGCAPRIERRRAPTFSRT